MRTASITDTKFVKSRSERLWDELARRALYSALRQLPRGQLVVEYRGTREVFGRPARGCELQGCMQIHHPSAFRQLLLGGSIGAGEAYMAGLWSSPDLVAVIRVMAANIHFLNDIDSGRSPLRRLGERLLHRLNANTLRGSRENIAAHYDLGNAFFRLFLDPTMMYSSAVYPTPAATLEEAAVYKLDAICRKLRLTESDHLLEIGTGWGGLAIHAATHFGCRVTTTTISREQFDHACDAVAAAGLQDRITVLLQDYRHLEGSFDKLVSIEMIEAVGHEYYDSYFCQCSRLLKPDGLMLLQAITIPDQRYVRARRSVDFIQRYIFPGGCLPSNEVMARCVARQTDMQIVELEDIGQHYRKTLADWRRRFLARLPAVKALGFDDVFCRMWEFYLCYCEGGFAERAISTVQIVLAKPYARENTAAS